MIATSAARRRRGITQLEFAIAAPVFVIGILSLIVLGLGISDSQRLAAVSREAARWGAVHGMEYARQTGNPAATPADIYQQVIAPRLSDLDQSALSYEITWQNSNEPTRPVTDASGKVVPVQNVLTVTLRYQWSPIAIFPARTLTSSARMPMAF